MLFYWPIVKCNYWIKTPKKRLKINYCQNCINSYSSENIKQVFVLRQYEWREKLAVAELVLGEIYANVSSNRIGDRAGERSVPASNAMEIGVSLGRRARIYLDRWFVPRQRRSAGV